MHALYARSGAVNGQNGQAGINDVSDVFWLIGILTGMGGATLTIVGFMLQKLSHRHAKSSQWGYWSDSKWLLGLSLWICGQLLCWCSDGLANKSVLACFNCWNIVVVFALAPFYLGEAVDPKTGLGVAIIVAGCIWVLFAGPREYYEQTTLTINQSWASPSVLCAAGLSVLFMLVMYFRNAAGRVVSAVEFASISAVFAWFSVLLSKCASALLVTTVHTENQLGHWHFWAFISAMFVLGTLQLHTLNMGLKVGAATAVLPTYEALSMTGQVALCGVFFGEFRAFGALDFLILMGGFACVLCGVATLVHYTPVTSVGDSAHISEDAAERAPLLSGEAGNNQNKEKAMSTSTA